MTKNKNNVNGRAAAVSQIIAGVAKHFPDVTQKITILGASLTIGDATTKMQTFVANRAATVAAQATAKDKLAVEKAQRSDLEAFISAFESFVRASFGAQAGVLGDFGMAPPKAHAPQTAEQKAVAAAKRKATREARGTTSPKQKKSVKGNVTATLVVTSGTPAPAAAPVVTPAPSAAAAPGGAGSGNAGGNASGAGVNGATTPVHTTG